MSVLRQSFFVRAFIIFSWVFIFLLFFSPKSVLAYYTNMPANMVIGQQNFTSNSANQGGSVGANTFYLPYRTFYDGRRLFVADFFNYRVLIYNSLPTNNNTPADVVIGQQDFTSRGVNQSGNGSLAIPNGFGTPAYIHGDGSRLFIADTDNHRILIYNTIPTTNNASANIVIGQNSMTTRTTGSNPNQLSFPRGVFYDSASGKLFVVDTSNHRVLIYNQVPTSNNVSADVVVGQPNLTTVSAGTTASKLSDPFMAKVINGKLIIADASNNRVLIYNSIPTSNGAIADVVVGQQNFITGSSNQGGTAGPNTIKLPSDVDYDGTRFYVADSLNYRVLVFQGIPTTNNESAYQVIGQPNFTSVSVNQGGSAGANTFNFTSGVAVVNKNLWVNDASNNRILIYNNILSGPALSLSSITTGTNGKLTAQGNIQLGERGTYGLLKMEASVNGEGFVQVTSKDGGTDDGSTQTRYNFTHEFAPWVSNGSQDTWSERGYTLKLKATSLNAEEDTLFHSEPFTLTNISGSILPTFSFTVNKNQWNRLKDNLDSYEVQTKKDGSNDWITYLDKIPVDITNTSLPFATTYDPTNGIITVRSTSKTLPPGKYTVKLSAKDKWNHHQDSNELIYTSLGGTSYKPNLTITSEWFPIQITKISGISSNIISNFNPVILPTYISNTSYPTFTGVAFNNATITMQVTDTKSGKSRKYETKVINSTWKITPTLYSSSIVDVWVTDGNGRYNELPPIVIHLR